MKNAAAIGCFFLSGIAGLIYEVCWIRRASLVFGSTLFAVSTVLAVFFLGLALGSDVFGRISRRVTRPLRLYALLEIGLAALALASLPAFGLAESLYGLGYRALGAEAGALWGLRVALVALVLLPPTFLMGGTLPLFCRHFVRRRSRIAGSVGFLYAVNTLGAALGCAATGFLLIPAIGVAQAVMAGAILNLISGVAVLALRPEPGPIDEQPARGDPPLDSRGRAVIAGLVFLTGFVALGQEVLWTRFLALLVRNTVYTYTLTLTVVLLGIVLGSLLASRGFDRARHRVALFAGLQALTGLTVLALMMLPPAAWQRLGEGIALYAALLLPAAVLSGASFPLAVRMVVEEPALAGFGVGRIAALNTLGGIAGSLVIGFAALPRLGLQASALLTTGASLAAGIAALLLLERRLAIGARLAAAAAGLLLWLLIPRLTGTRLPADYLANGGELVEFREGLQSNLAVVRREGVLNLEIDRLWQGQGRKSHQIMAAHLPMLLHPDARRVLVVGVGAGQTPGRFLMHDVQRVDCVDIEPAIFDLIRSHFDTAWMRDPRIALIRADGRNVLTYTDARYDLISIEVGQVFRPGVANFYTAEFYRDARARLAPGGVLSQFVPLRFLSPEAFRSVVRTFLDAFPRAALWYNTSELLLIGTNGDRLALDPGRLERLAADGAVARDLRFSYWNGPAHWLVRPAVLLGDFLCGPPALAALAGSAPAYRDDRPVLEYETARMTERETSEIENLALLRGHLDPIAGAIAAPSSPGASPGLPGLLAQAAEVRERNLGDIVTQACLVRVPAARAAGGHAAVVALLARGLEANPENAEAHRVLGDALLHLDRVAEAERHYHRALALREDDARAHRGLAFALHREGRIGEAIPEYRAALDLGDEDAEVRNNLGAALGQQGDLEAALREFERAVALRPEFEEARQNLESTRAALAQGDR